MDHPSLTIIMTCWDQYSDVRRVCFESLEKFGGLPYNFIIACNNQIDDPYKKGEVIVCEKNSTGTQRLLEAALKVETEYLLMITEDALFMGEPDCHRIEEMVDFMNKNNIIFCKMVPYPNKKGKKIPCMDNVKWINKRQAYGENLLCAIYEKEYFLKLLGDASENPWQLEERLLNKAVNSSKGYYKDRIVLTDNPLKIMFCVNYGKWNRDAVKVINKIGLTLDESRAKLSLKEMYVVKLKSLVTRNLPVVFRCKIKKMLKKIGFKFATSS